MADGSPSPHVLDDPRMAPEDRARPARDLGEPLAPALRQLVIRIVNIVQIPTPIGARSGIKVPWASYTVWPSTKPGRRRPGPVERDFARAKPGEVVVEVLVRRLDYVVKRLACSATAQAQLFMQREHTRRGAADVEHALAHVEVEDMEGGHPAAVVRRVPVDALDREVDGERRASEAAGAPGSSAQRRGPASRARRT
jgi:hypothetical protein